MPREKLASTGVTSLDDVELLAILLGTGAARLSVIELAESLLHDFGGLRGLLQANAMHAGKAAGTGAGQNRQASGRAGTVQAVPE